MATRAAKLALRGKALTDTGTEIGIVNNADATAITIDASENVGIGTTSPITKLDASQDNIGGNVAFGIFQSGNAYGNVASSASLYLGATYHSLANSAKITSTHSSGTTGDHAQDLTFNPINSGSTSFEAMRISSAGNVGIGSSSPVRQLEIKDDGTIGQAIVGIIADAGDPAGIFMGTTSNNNVGGIRYFTDTNKLALRANDEDRLLIDSSGIVTKPYQPAFKQAWGSLNAGSSRILSTNSGLTAKTDRDVFNTGNHFSAATGRFTAPVAGTFLLGFSFMRNGANGAGADIRIKKNGSRIYSRHYKANYVQAYETSSTTVISKCAVNDYFTFEISASDSLYEDDAFQFGYLLG